MQNRIGTFYTSCRVANHVDRKKLAEVPKVLVDTGAEFTWINGETLKSIGVKREEKDYQFSATAGKDARATGRQEACPTCCAFFFMPANIFHFVSPTIPSSDVG